MNVTVRILTITLDFQLANKAHEPLSEETLLTYSYKPNKVL